MESPVYGECPRHKGNSMFDCPMCAMENFKFNIPKDIILPPCDSASGKQTEIDTLPKPIKYVWVTFDPLYERVVCVHEKADSECDKCRRLMKQRIKDGSNPCYYPEASKFKIKP